MTKFLTLFTVLFTLTACGCMLEEGDSTNISDYWNGCWAEAKGDPSEV